MKTSRTTIALGCLLFLCPVTHAGPLRLSSRSVPRLEITPNPAFIDQPVKIVLRNFPARRIVAVQLLGADVPGQAWQSHAEFWTDGRGYADLSTQAPISGAYRHADPSGLFWSLSPAGTNKVDRDNIGPWHYSLTTSVNGQTLATATLERFLLAPGVRQIHVHNLGLRGTLFLPAGKGPWPGVIVLSGSEGGLWGPPAAYLAAKGYAAFALAYFHYEDLPKSMENTRLEYFQTAIHWLQARADIKPGSIGVLGISRGGELVLLLGANFPEIHAVVAVSGSSVRWGGVGAGAPFKAIWTWHGKPLPFLSQVKLTGQQTNELKRLFQTNPQAAGFAWCSMQLRDNAAVARARIPVGKINGPVLLISGNDDKLWPSTYMDDMVIRRLADERHPFRDRHLAYPDAGHALYLPNQPTTMNSTVFLTGDRVNFGGNAQGNAAAAADAWPRIIAFLNRILN